MPSGPPSVIWPAALAAEPHWDLRDLAHGRDRPLDVLRMLLAGADVPEPPLPVGGRVEDGDQKTLAGPAQSGPHEEVALELSRSRGGEGQVAVASREEDHAGHRGVGRAQQEE